MNRFFSAQLLSAPHAARMLYRYVFVAMIVACSVAGPAATAGLLFQSLHEFPQQGSGPKGANAGLVLGTDGNFYGTTDEGGQNNMGTVFKVTPDGALTTVFSFNTTNGSIPNSLIEGSDGNFYGTTGYGGANDDSDGQFNGSGTVFKITPGGAFTSLCSFNGTNGSYPSSLIEGTDGNFYGTALYGGKDDNGNVSPLNGNGIVFKLGPDGVLTTLGYFDGTNGRRPSNVVQGTDGALYGTTLYGGTYLSIVGGVGTAFKITDSGSLTTLVSFNGTNGGSPNRVLRGRDGNLYGTTGWGGALYTGGLFGGGGTVFKLTPDGALTTLVSFFGTNGHSPFSLVQGSDGSFYGTTSPENAPNYGTVFKATTNGTMTTLFAFNVADCGSPVALLQGTDGKLYGTTSGGGTSSYGTLFSIAPDGDFSRLASFTATDGATPYSSLVQGRDSNFYGTTYSGGTSGFGTVFNMTPGGAFTILHSFDGTNGSYPAAALVQGSDGYLYGTTSGLMITTNGGVMHDNGTVFRAATNGSFTTLHSFTGADGRNPIAGLIQGNDGDFYGTTPLGGPNDYGTVFKITPNGTLSTLHFFEGTDGLFLVAALVQGNDGSFYGTTAGGGPNNFAEHAPFFQWHRWH